MLTDTQLILLRQLLKDEQPSVDQIDSNIALLEAEAVELRDIQREIMASEPPETDRENAFTRSARQDVRNDLTFLVQGVTNNDGVTNPRLAARCGQPGLAEVERTIERLRARREQAVARLAEAARPWPRPFRLLPGKKHGLPDRNVRPGEVIELTEAQAHAFADKFEPVQPQEVQRA